MTARDGLDTQLRGWMRNREPLPTRGDLVEGALARTAGVRQRPPLLVRTGEPGTIALPMPKLGRRGLLLLGVALATLAIVGGAFRAGAPTAPSSSPSASPDHAPVEELGRFTDRQLSGFGAALLRDGRVLLVGGVDTTAGEQAVAQAWVFDPTTKRITPTGAMTDPRERPHAITLADGRALVFGGSQDGSSASVLSTAELYDPASGTFTSTERAPAPRADQPCGALNAVPWTLVRATLLPDGRVFVSGGNAGGCSSTKADLFDPASGRWTQLDIGCDAARGAQALLADGRLLVVCVQKDDGRALASVVVRAQVFDPATDTFAEAAAPPAPVWQATVLADGRVLLTGGSPILYDPAADSYRDLPTGRRPFLAQPAFDIEGGRVLFLGAAPADAEQPTLIFDPRSESFTGVTRPGVEGREVTVRLGDGRILAVGYQLDVRLLDPRQLP